MDMKATVEELSKGGARVHRLALGGVDLTRSSGSMTMSVLTAVAQFERDLLIERTQAGLQRAKGTGSILGRPAVLNAAQRKIVREKVGSRHECAGARKAACNQPSDHHARA